MRVLVNRMAALKAAHPEVPPLLIITAFVCLNTLPFCYRAYWLDEYFYMKGALGVFTNPLFPQDVPYIWFGAKFPTAGFHSHPPLLIYIIWSIIAATGSLREVYLHVSFLVFPILAGIACYYLSCRFTERPLLATLIVLATPAFVVMSHTIMSDMVFQAFLTAGFASYLYGLDRDDSRLLTLSSFFMILACFTSYQGLLFMLVLPLYAWLSGKLNFRSVLYCVPPYLFIAAWLIMGYFHYEKIPPLGGMIYIGRYLFREEVMVGTLVATATFIGGTTISPMASLLFLSKPRSLLWYFFVVLLSILLAARFAAEYGRANKILFVILAANGISITGLVLVESFRHFKPSTLRSENLFLGAWFIVVLLFYLMLAEAMRARFLLALVPPLVFFVVNFIDGLPAHAGSNRQGLLGALLAMTWITALVVAIADYKFVSNYRKFADYFNSAYGDMPYGKWGAVESGLRYYMERVGVKVLSEEDDSPQALDLIVRPDKLFRYPLAQDLEAELVLMEQKDFPSYYPIRTASFHDSKIYLLPFYLSRRPWDTIDIYQVSLAVDKLPEAEITGSHRDRIYPTYWVVGGKRKLTLLQSINSKIKYKLSMPPDAAISLSVARSPNSESPVQFRVAISDDGKTEETLFSQRLADPAEERRWHEVTMNATKFANREVTLAFEVRADSEKYSADDVVGWADLIIGPKRVLIR